MISLLPAFFLGVVLLLFSADSFVKVSSKVWLAFKISPLVIGTTVVALGTSLPELAVSLIASAKNDQGLAVGNIIGSNIVNVFLVLAVGILLGNINIGTNKTQRNALVLVLATMGYFFLSVLIPSARVFGLIMVFSAVVFTFFEVQMGIVGRNHEDKKYVNGKKNCKFSSKLFWTLVFSSLGIAGGGFAVVHSIENISLLTGYSTTVLGLSITAIATSLPELLTTVFCCKKDQGKIATGDILGSNIYNLLLIGGIVSLFSPTKTILMKDFVVLGIATFCLVFLVFRYAGRKVPRKFGIILLLFFFAYMFTLR